MAATIKIVLRKEEKQDGTFPLAIRITKDRKASFLFRNTSNFTQEKIDNPILYSDYHFSFKLIFKRLSVR